MDESNLGLYYLAALDIFEMMKLPEYSHLNVRVSLFEIYGGKLFDLLNERKQIKCLEDSKGKVCFPGLTEHAVHAPEHVMHFIEQGSENRSTGTTSRNADSSRSHAVLQIKLVKSAGRKGTVEHGESEMLILVGNPDAKLKSIMDRSNLKYLHIFSIAQADLVSLTLLEMNAVLIQITPARQLGWRVPRLILLYWR